MPVAGPVAFLLKGYPRLSETFIAQEIHGLEQAGLNIRIYSLRPPREEQRHPVNAEIQAPVAYLPERLRDAPGRVLRALLHQPRAGLARALRKLCADMAHAPSPDRLRRFGQALVLANEMPDEIAHIHAHFLHSPASVARYAAALADKPWSCSAHARDIWTIGEREKRAKLADMDWLVTCTASGASHLASLAPESDKVELVYHGIDLARFPTPPVREGRNGSDPNSPLRLLSVGRAVEKKGFDTLLDALAGLPDTLHWRWTHIGEGVLLSDLKRRADALGVGARIFWRGACTQTEVIEAYRAADLFVLPCRIARDGDRDGLPNVLLEAQSQGLACLSTNISAIPELIEDGTTGRLVAPGDAAALREALQLLAADPALRTRLGRAGRAHVEAHFSHEAGLRRLAPRFGLQADALKARANA